MEAFTNTTDLAGYYGIANLKTPGDCIRYCSGLYANSGIPRNYVEPREKSLKSVPPPDSDYSSAFARKALPNICTLQDNK